MSAISSSTNYGGRVQDNQQGIKQFYTSIQGVTWIYKRLLNNKSVITPSDPSKPVLINNDLIIEGSIYNPSDERLKTEIREIDPNEFNSLFTLNPIHFKYNNNNKSHYGLLAQDVEKVFPDLVNMNNGYKIVNYQEFIPLIIAKMKSMENDIQLLKTTTLQK